MTETFDSGARFGPHGCHHERGQTICTVCGMGVPSVRSFETGATRDIDHDKFDYEGFLSPLVIERFAAYMHKNRLQKDGTMRDGDNWQKGMPLDSYMKSGWRHFFDWWKQHRGLKAGESVEDALCALLFNVQGYLHEHLKKKKTAMPDGFIALDRNMTKCDLLREAWKEQK